MIVIDASVGFEIVTRTEKGLEMARHISGPVHVPELFDIEVIQTVRRHRYRNEIDENRAASAIDYLEALPAERHSHLALRGRIWSLRDNVTAYDAAYLALAEQLDCDFWTRDRKFEAIPNLAVTILTV